MHSCVCAGVVCMCATERDLTNAFGECLLICAEDRLFCLRLNISLLNVGKAIFGNCCALGTGAH